MGVAFLPVYARLLGIEQYGLIGVYAVLQAWMTLMDFGLTPAISREMANWQAGTRTTQSTRELLRSLEWLCVAIALILVLLVALGSGWLAHAWLRPKLMSHEVVKHCLETMGIVVSMRWIEQIYRGALQGMQDLVWLGVAQVFVGTLRWAGAYVVLSRHPVVIDFFIWQGLVSALTVGCFIWRTYNKLPSPKGSVRFSLVSLQRIKGFASGMFVSSCLSFILMQTDKIVVGKLLPLAVLGAYTLAANAASGLTQLVNPMSMALYPKLTELVASGDNDGLARTYLKACQWMAVLVVPPAVVLIFFPEMTLFTWTGNAVLAKGVAPILSIMALGTLCNGLMTLPYFTQLAFAWTSLAVKTNAFAVLIFVPGMLWVVPREGPIGAAYLWFLLNASYLFVMAHIMHRRVLKGLKASWYRSAVIIPVVTCLGLAAVLKYFAPTPPDRSGAALTLCGIALSLMAAVGWLLGDVRQDIVHHLRRWTAALRAASTR